MRRRSSAFSSRLTSFLRSLELLIKMGLEIYSDEAGGIMLFKTQL